MIVSGMIIRSPGPLRPGALYWKLAGRVGHMWLSVCETETGQPVPYIFDLTSGQSSMRSMFSRSSVSSIMS